MSLTLATSFHANPEVLLTELTDRAGQPEAVLLHLATQKYFSLNATGLCIWKTLEQPQSLAAAARALTTAFDVSQAQAEASVLRLAEELAAAELIVPAGTSA